MKRLSNKRGFSVIEAIASVAVITLVFTTAVVIILSMRNQVTATENKRSAIEVASSIKEDLEESLDYTNLSLWIEQTTKEIDHVTCGDFNSPVSCLIFIDNQMGVISEDLMLITFYAQTEAMITHKIISYQITIQYYKTRTITIEGVIYE